MLDFPLAHGLDLKAIALVRATWRLGAIKIEVKNIAEGRLRTDFCRGCLHEPACGEGIYDLRVGVDGLVKPSLLRTSRWIELRPEGDLRTQVLATVHAMVGDWSCARFVRGAPA